MSWLRSPLLHWLVALGLLALVLLVGDALCYQIALPIEIDVQGRAATLYVDNKALSLGPISHLVSLEFAYKDPVVHEYQLDDTDSTNNYTLDPTYLNEVSTSPYYRFQAWMRDLDGTSRWRNLQVWGDGQAMGGVAFPENGARISLPSAGLLRLNVLLQRPETPMTLNLIAQNGEITHITIDRNNRHIQVTRFIPGVGDNQPVTSTFFPVDSAPFAAMVIDSLIRTLLWALLVIAAIVVGEVIIGLVGKFVGIGTLGNRFQGDRKGRPYHDTQHGEPYHGRGIPGLHHPPDAAAAPGDDEGTRVPWGGGRYIRPLWHRLTKQIHPIGLLALAASLIFVAWIARVQYNGEPHIFDASAYLFSAKMYASGHLSVPIPPAVDRFPGPFMVQFNGHWFGQYDPGTSLTLVPGVWLGVPWLVEPVLGTLALLGIGLIAARLYDRRVATLAVILGALSPFYSYLAASYLSHAVALFYLVWGLWTLIRFIHGGAGWNLPLAAALFGMASLTRDQVTLLFVGIVLLGILALSCKQLLNNWRRWIVPALTSIVVALVFICIHLGFNKLLTGNPWMSPRLLFFAGDHWGFGPGVGFYGEHTLAAGFVTLDELLTSLAIDLFGWPFYLTLAFLAIPFLTRKAVGADWILLAGAVIMTGAYVGYFYHGIYLGPRYLFETLPFLLILTARGILMLGATGKEVSKMIVARLATIILLISLITCNLLYFMPRQVELHRNYTGLPNGFHIDLAAVYHPPVHNAVVVTSDYWIYPFVLFPLNDPMLHGDVIYAMAANPADYAELRQAFPGRTLYQLEVDADGTVHYVELIG